MMATRTIDIAVVHTRLHTQAHTHTHTSRHTQSHTHTSRHTHTHTHKHKCTHRHTHTTHNAHTQSHTHTPAPPRLAILDCHQLVDVLSSTPVTLPGGSVTSALEAAMHVWMQRVEDVYQVGPH